MVVKRYLALWATLLSSVGITLKRSYGDGDTWCHARITLRPVNPDFQPIVLTGADEGQIQVVAEIVAVVGGE